MGNVNMEARQIHFRGGNKPNTVADELDSLKSGLTNLDNEVTGDATVYPYADVITIEDAVPANLADCKVKIEPVQSGSGDPSPTNIRPITGHTEASVEVTDGDETTKTYTIALGSTIYGGTVDFDSGVMTVTHGIADMGDFTWEITNASAGSVNSTAGITGAVNPPANLNKANMITEKYIVLPYYRNGREGEDANSTNGSFAIWVTSSNKMFVRDSNLANMTAEQVKTSLTGTHICYELATPTTIQLTPQQIQLLKGQNTLTASTGQISVTVNGVSGSIGAVQEQVNATDAALAELAEHLPDAPTTDGAYVLTVTVADGEPTYSWVSSS